MSSDQSPTVLCDPGPLLCYVSIAGPWGEKVLQCAGELAGGSVRWAVDEADSLNIHHHNTGQNDSDDTQRYL